ncbi:hypothetical protein Cni_G26904 [Canna indica]|uniref:Uncharacterized protein n=1 Tax=Canna indica TaxID=4628 RepID=A0AAQ3QMG5_9LILI|nr:hypothetical protein Cni_G26904 [Canna indica]
MILFGVLVKSHPNASGLRNKPFSHLDSLSIIFSKDRAIGERAKDPADSSASILREVVNLDEEVPLGSPEGVEIDSPAAQPSANNTQNHSTSGHTQHNSRKRKANAEAAMISSLVEFVNKISTMCEGTSQGIQDVASYFKTLPACSEFQQDVYQGLLEIEDLGLDESQMIEVGEIIAYDPYITKYFFSLPMIARKTYVLKKLGVNVFILKSSELMVGSGFGDFDGFHFVV